MKPYRPLLFAALLVGWQVRAERCDTHLESPSAQQVLLQFLGRNSPPLNMKATELEIAASLRAWKKDLAKALNRSENDLELHLESSFSLTPGYLTILLVESVYGLRPLIAAEYDPREQLLKYINPIYSQKLRWSTFYKPGPYHLVAFEDSLRRVPKAGDVRAILSLKIAPPNL